MKYYIEDNGIGIHRMDDTVCQTYDFARARWVHSMEIMDMLIGELWVDEVSEAEEDAFIAKRPANSEDMGVPTGRRDAKTLPHARTRPACSSAMGCTIAPYRRLGAGFSFKASQKTETNSATTTAAVILTRLITPRPKAMRSLLRITRCSAMGFLRYSRYA